jgi:hypothetical protein
MNTKETECCPKFDPEPWDSKTHHWKNKLFIQDQVKQIFHRPINMAKVVNRMWSKIQKAEAAPPNEDFLMLAYDPSPWKSELHMTVIKEVPDAKNMTLTGEFFSKVFDGPYNAVPKWVKKMDKLLAEKNEKLKKYYFYFTTCPKCAEKYGHNYCVAFAELYK